MVIPRQIRCLSGDVTDFLPMQGIKAKGSLNYNLQFTFIFIFISLSCGCIHTYTQTTCITGFVGASSIKAHTQTHKHYEYDSKTPVLSFGQVCGKIFQPLNNKTCSGTHGLFWSHWARDCASLLRQSKPSIDKMTSPGLTKFSIEDPSLLHKL